MRVLVTNDDGIGAALGRLHIEADEGLDAVAHLERALPVRSN